MFDDQTKQAVPPSNLPTEPVDVLAGVDAPSVTEAPKAIPDALSAGLLKKKESEVKIMPNIETAPSPAPVYSMKDPILGKILFGVLIVVILGAVGLLGWWLYVKFLGSNGVPALQEQTNQPAVTLPEQQEQITIPPVEETLPVEVPVAEETSVNNETSTTEAPDDMTNDSILFGEAVDSDQDGLDDIREAEIGTNPNNSDTDGDGLTDGDEVLSWKTDPLKSDTDGDGFADGVEVQNGYDPLGLGRLLQGGSSPASASTQ